MIFVTLGIVLGELLVDVLFVSSLEMAQSKGVAARAQEAQEHTWEALKYFEASITIAVGGVDVDIKLLISLRMFIEDHCIVGFCVVERGGALTHKHLQMAVKGNGNT